MESNSFAQRSTNCCILHEAGWFYIISPLVFLPLIFLEPIVEWRAIFLILLTMVWFIADIMPVGAVAWFPIAFYPFLGVISTNEICVAYSRDAQMVFMLSNYIAITLNHCKLDKRLACSFIDIFGIQPKRLLLMLMLTSYVLSALIPDAVAAALMIPTVKAILQIFQDINIAQQIDETKVLQDDEKPYPSKISNAFYIGIAFAITIGGSLFLTSSETGYMLKDQFDYFLPKVKDQLLWNFLLFSLPITTVLLVFTAEYIQFVFLGKFRKEDQIVYDEAEAKAAYEDMRNSLGGWTIHQLIVLILYVIMFMLCIFLRPLVAEGIADKMNDKVIQVSAVVMLINLLLFVLPNSFGFLNYFYCKEPPQYKTIPSTMIWSVVSRNMPWNYFLVYGSTLAFGVVTVSAALPRFMTKDFIYTESFSSKLMGLMGISAFLTLICGSQYLTEGMLAMAAKAAFFKDEHPGLFMLPVTFACSFAFMLPMSSVANCMSSGWANLRSKDVILAGVGPTVIGLLLTFVFSVSLLKIVYPEFAEGPY